MILRVAQIYLVLPVILLVFGSLLHAELRTFTNDFGESIKAELIELKDDGTSVTIRLENGRKIDAALSAFSSKDKKYIQKWWKDVLASEKVLKGENRLVINVKMNKKSRSGSYDRWYADDKIQSFFPEVTIENKELQAFVGNEVRVVVFAKDMRNQDQIIVVSATSLKTDLKDLDKTFLEAEPFRLRHYEYNSSYSNYEYEYGYSYTGYAVVIKNSKGEVTHEKATKTKYLNPEYFFKCKNGEIYDEKFERKLKAYPNSYYVQ